ncbi:MAG: DNA primase [Lachnospiraceae bacterium]|nr:DNA primase [Lachnospiraceae bacterium]
MARFSDELIEEVRSANNIVDVIGSYVSLKKKGNSYFGLCPFHNEKTGSFSVSDRKQMYYCFGCGAGGNVFTFLMEYESFNFAEAMEFLAERAGIKLPEHDMTPTDKAKSDKKDQILELNKKAAVYYYNLLRAPQGATGLKYFKEKRELDDETMRKFGLGFADVHSNSLYQYLKSQGATDEILKESGLCGIDERKGGYDRFWNRVMFPIMDIRDHVIGFGGRVMGDGEPKYLNSPETIAFDKSHNLYGLNLARHSKRPYLLLCEGYMDVISLHKAGFDCAVASLGTAFTDGHANLMKRYVKDVYITYDSDGAGVKAALRAIPILRNAGLNAKVINMKPYKDPDEFIKALSAEEYEKRIDGAENGFMFEVRHVYEGFDMSDPAKRTEFQNEIASMLTIFTDELERENYLTEVSRKYDIEAGLLRRKVNELANKKAGKPVTEPLKDGRAIGKKQEDGRLVSQRYLITLLIDHPELYRQIKDLVTPSDFTEELYYKVAMMVYDGLENNNLVPASIISRFESEEEHNTVASLFQAEIRHLTTDDELKHAITDTLYKVKQNSIDYSKSHTGDIDIGKAIEKMKEDQRILGEIKKLNINLSNNGGN